MTIEDNTTTTLTDDLALLNEEPEVVEQPLEEQPEQELNETDEIEEPEVVEEEPQEVKDELPPTDRSKRADILKKYPNLFKDFPDLQDSIYREREYASVFPSIADAKEASNLAETYKDLASDITIGGGAKLVDALNDSKELAPFASNFLPNLFRVNRDLYLETLTPAFQNVVRSFFTDGLQRQSEDVQNAAKLFALYLFGDADIATGKKSAVKEVRKEDETVKNERQELQRERFETYKTDVATSINSERRNEVLKGFPKMSNFLRDALHDKIIAEVDRQIASDQSHMKYINSLWKRAMESKYDPSFKTRIKDAYLARAKQIIPTVRRRMLTEAGVTFVNKPVEEQEEVTPRRASSAGRVPGPVKAPTAKQVDWRKTSDLDILNDKPTLKKG